MNSKHCLMFLSIFMVMNNLITASITIRKCASELEFDTCYLESYSKDNDIDITTEYYGKCKSGKICDYIHDTNYAYQCVSPKRQLKLDEDCVVNEECQSGYCKDKKCSYLNTDAPCTGSEQCGDGSYCRYLDRNYNDRVCTKYSMENEKCEFDYRCIPYLACGKDNKCVKKYSQEDGTQTKDSDACQSGVSFDFANIQKTLCVSEVTLTGECSSDQDECTLTYKSGANEGTKNVGCVYKSDGKTLTCNSNEGSDEQKKYIQLYKEKYDELEEEDFEEITNYVTLDSKDILEAYVMYAHRVELLDAEECLIEAYISKQASYMNQGIISLKKILLIGLLALLM